MGRTPLFDQAMTGTEKIRYQRYGVSPQQYADMLAAQGGGCAICGGVPDKRALAVDHDHGSGVVRGLLCRGCNTGLGNFRDDPALLEAAMAYLDARLDIRAI